MNMCPKIRYFYQATIAFLLQNEFYIKNDLTNNIGILHDAV